MCIFEGGLLCADRVCDEERLRRCPFLFVTTDRGRPREMGGKAMSESVRVPGWLASGKSTPSSLPACRWVNCLRAILRGGFENGGSTPYLGITPVGHIQTLFTSVWGSPPGFLRLSNASADKPVHRFTPRSRSTHRGRIVVVGLLAKQACQPTPAARRRCYFYCCPYRV